MYNSYQTVFKELVMLIKMFLHTHKQRLVVDKERLNGIWELADTDYYIHRMDKQ